MKDYQKLKEIIQKANPEIMELKFGCELMTDRQKEVIIDGQATSNGNTWKWWTDTGKKFYDDQIKNNQVYHGSLIGDGVWFKILGKPIHLADVLMAIEKKNPDIMIDVSGRFLLNEQPAPLCQECSWNLKDDNLDNQSDEIKLFLINILI